MSHQRWHVRHITLVCKSIVFHLLQINIEIEPQWKQQYTQKREKKKIHAKVGATSTTRNLYESNSTACVLPVGCRYVSGGKRISASAGNTESHCRSAPRCSAFLVSILKRRDSVEMLYATAVMMSAVVDSGASCIHVQICQLSICILVEKEGVLLAVAQAAYMFRYVSCLFAYWSRMKVY